MRKQASSKQQEIAQSEPLYEEGAAQLPAPTSSQPRMKQERAQKQTASDVRDAKQASKKQTKQ